jgi:hypothetical protein
MQGKSILEDQNLELVTDYTGQIVGWFNVNKAQCVQEAKDWNGVSRATCVQGFHEALYLTAMGRWVMYSWSDVQGGNQSYHLMQDQRAHRWLMVNASTEDINGLPMKAKNEYLKCFYEKEI